MPSDHSTNILTVISRCINSASTPHISETRPYSSWYKVIPIRILVDVYYATGENNYVNSTPGTCVYPLTTFI